MLSKKYLFLELKYILNYSTNIIKAEKSNNSQFYSKSFNKGGKN